jgi:cytidylate kinase
MSKQERKTTITIARQLGSGGSYIGRRLAERLGFKYVDREVLRLAAEELNCDERELAARAERVSTFWERVSRSLSFGPPDGPYAPPPLLRSISDRELFERQTGILKQIARQHDCVIVGWGSALMLPRHRRRFSIFCHAPVSFRVRRVQEIYPDTDEARAKELIAESDEMRQHYIEEMTDKDWVCLQNYHLAIDTSILPLPQVVELILGLLKLKGIHVA